MCDVIILLIARVLCHSPISVSSIQKAEPELYAQLEAKYGDSLPTTLYFNKGL